MPEEHLCWKSWEFKELRKTVTTMDKDKVLQAQKLEFMQKDITEIKDSVKNVITKIDWLTDTFATKEELDTARESIKEHSDILSRVSWALICGLPLIIIWLITFIWSIYHK